VKASRRSFAKVIATLLVLGGLVALQLSTFFGYVVIGLLGLTILGLLIGLFVALVYGAMKRRWKPALDIGVKLVVCLTSIFIVQFISYRQQADSMASAQPMIAAVERFHSETGKYPESIADLIPTFLQSIPRTSMGLNGTDYDIWVYPDGYRLVFPLQGWNMCSYDSRSKQWEVLD